jgi:hypothetical protein
MVAVVWPSRAFCGSVVARFVVLGELLATADVVTGDDEEVFWFKVRLVDGLSVTPLGVCVCVCDEKRSEKLWKIIL